MRWERIAMLMLAILLALSSFYAFSCHRRSLELQAEVLESTKTVEELESSLNAAKEALARAERDLEEVEFRLTEAARREGSLREELSKLSGELSRCLANLSRGGNATEGCEVRVSTCESKLSYCESRLRALERASVHVAHWWHDSVGCVPCGTASTKVHVVLFNAGYERADDVRVVITLYGRAGNPISVLRVDAGSIDGRSGRLVESSILLPADFQRAEVKCEWD